MIKLTDLKKSTQATIAKIAKASNLSPEKVLRIMLKPSCGDMVTTHLNYGLESNR